MGVCHLWQFISPAMRMILSFLTVRLFILASSENRSLKFLPIKNIGMKNGFLKIAILARFVRFIGQIYMKGDENDSNIPL